ncbi:hypothetical protein DYD21_07385 [Rhodohalobacter sp. SW132]|uniref:acyloxyacyl hydrolase n=1 Tax=Rhodohalobacter sp. SW132 TaxID=2293433 RepID=UPI000E21E8E7|nr:acyloxyacyl hydrolase [Rhodohalobacter sp. SW132]REL37601.1 hypothetical protein DYD21_07385 [Rhodohalobacter sp. SW132]
MKSFERSTYRHISNALILVFLLLGCGSSLLYAQSETISDTADHNSSKIGVSAVYSPNSFAAWGKIKNSQSYSIKGQVWFTEYEFRNFRTRFGSEIIITQHLEYPLNGIDGPRDQRLGFGLIPVKFMIPMGTSTVRPITFFSAGLLFLNEKLPAADGASLNYLLNLGTGLEITLTERLDVQIGYSLQHLSNANSAGVNPGIDYHNFFFTVVL